MSSTPSEPTDKTSSTRKQKAKRSRYLRLVAYIIISVVCQGILVIAASTPLQKSSSLVIVLYSLAPTILLAIAFFIVQTFDEHAETLGETIEEYTKETKSQYSNNLTASKELSKLIEQFNELVENAGQTLNFYGNYRALLRGNAYKQKQLISSYLKHAMDGPILIQPINRLEFFRLHELGIKECSTWQAIHQAPISRLDNYQYLNDLKELKKGEGPTLKQRIVILKQDEVKELYDDDIVAEFLRKTNGTDSYWITEEKFFLHFGVPRMKSAGGALYDDKLLLLRLEETELGMMSLDHHKDEIHYGIFRAFEDLNWSLQHNVPNEYFKKIEQKV